MQSYSCSEERIARPFASSFSHSFCAHRSVASFVIESLMNGVTSQLQSCWSEISRANEKSFSIIVLLKCDFLKRCALPNTSNCIASPSIPCSSCCACTRQRAASSVLNSCMNCERVKFPPCRSNLVAAPHCHQLERKLNKMIQLWASDRCQK